MLLGSYVNINGKKMLLRAAKEVASYGSSTLMTYTDAPQNTRRKAIEEMSISARRVYIAENGLTSIVVHAPYIVDLGNTIKPEMFPFAVQFLREEIVRAEALSTAQITLHPGTRVGAGMEAGITRIIEGLNEVLTKGQTVQIVLETMTGKDTEIGRTFEESAQIIGGVKLNEKLSVTFDTYYTNGAGYNIKEDFSGVTEEFNKTTGLDRLGILHIDDSENLQGSYRDQYTNVGFGTIGFDTLNRIAHDPTFDNIPKTLGAPYVGKNEKEAYAPYGKGAAVLKAQTFDSEVFPELLAEEVIL